MDFTTHLPWEALVRLVDTRHRPGPRNYMIENYRSQLLWNLFMSAPEVKTGMKNLGFSSPNL
jgi:hypothetical protein